jgi:hypothetical protein
VRAESLAAARRGVAFLAREQRPAGDFATDWSDRLDLGAAGRPESPFLTGLILHALRRLPGRREVAAILERGTGYLLDVRPPGGLYVFLQGIAPDLDDVCLLHLVLQESHPRRFDYARLARRVAATATDAGPFPTWLEDEVRWADIDPVVNLNVVRFLHRNRTPCPRALDWLRGELAAWDFIDGTRYYESPFAPLYFAATLPPALRRSLLPAPARLWSRLENRLDQRGDDLSVLDVAYLLAALVVLGGPARRVDELTGRLLERQGRAGGWPPWAAFRAYRYWGSATLSTALAVQALTAYAGSLYGLGRAAVR